MKPLENVKVKNDHWNENNLNSQDEFHTGHKGRISELEGISEKACRIEQIKVRKGS